METTKQQTDAYSIVTDPIIEQLKQNKVPWQISSTEAGYPRNLVTKIPFRGMNVWMLASLGYQQNHFLTYKQLKELGGTVKRGEKGHTVGFWRASQSDTVESGESLNLAFGYYMVYNIAQTNGLPEVFSIPPSPYPISLFDACEEIIEKMPGCPKIKRSKKSSYDPVKDVITMPKRETFTSTEIYYSALFQLLIHSTGHQKRLNRKSIAENPEFADDAYSQETLVAEIGACLINSAVGIENVGLNNGEGYIKGWLEALQQNPRIIVYASFQAQKAVEYILNVNPYEKQEVGEESKVEAL